MVGGGCAWSVACVCECVLPCIEAIGVGPLGCHWVGWACGSGGVGAKVESNFVFGTFPFGGCLDCQLNFTLFKGIAFLKVRPH